METMFKILISFLLVGVLSSCETKQDVWDTGTCSPYHDCSIMEYLRGDKYNWELTVAMIERAGLTDLFEGNDPDYKEITFFAPPSYSVLRYLWDNDMEVVSELTPEFCREMLLKHIVKGKMLKSAIAYRDPDYDITDSKQEGGTELMCVGGNRLKAYVDKSPYGGVPDVGPEVMYLYSFSAYEHVPLATPDIQPLNGVVHALNYNYILGKI